jgi:hypothetical protein
MWRENILKPSFIGGLFCVESENPYQKIYIKQNLLFYPLSELNLRKSLSINVLFSIVCFGLIIKKSLFFSIY